MKKIKLEFYTDFLSEEEIENNLLFYIKDISLINLFNINGYKMSIKEIESKKPRKEYLLKDKFAFKQRENNDYELLYFNNEQDYSKKVSLTNNLKENKIKAAFYDKTLFSLNTLLKSLENDFKNSTITFYGENILKNLCLVKSYYRKTIDDKKIHLCKFESIFEHEKYLKKFLKSVVTYDGYEDKNLICTRFLIYFMEANFKKIVENKNILKLFLKYLKIIKRNKMLILTFDKCYNILENSIKSYSNNILTEDEILELIEIFTPILLKRNIVKCILNQIDRIQFLEKNCVGSEKIKKLKEILITHLSIKKEHLESLNSDELIILYASKYINYKFSKIKDFIIMLLVNKIEFIQKYPNEILDVIEECGYCYSYSELYNFLKDSPSLSQEYKNECYERFRISIENGLKYDRFTVKTFKKHKEFNELFNGKFKKYKNVMKYFMTETL